MSARLPGCAGYPVVGDKSLEFYKDAVGFVQKRIEEYGSKIFVARFLNKPTVFVCSNAGVQEMLNGELLIVRFRDLARTHPACLLDR